MIEKLREQANKMQISGKITKDDLLNIALGFFVLLSFFGFVVLVIKNLPE